MHHACMMHHEYRYLVVRDETNLVRWRHWGEGQVSSGGRGAVQTKQTRLRAEGAGGFSVYLHFIIIVGEISRRKIFYFLYLLLDEAFFWEHEPIFDPKCKVDEKSPLPLAVKIYWFSYFTVLFCCLQFRLAALFTNTDSGSVTWNTLQGNEPGVTETHLITRPAPAPSWVISPGCQRKPRLRPRPLICLCLLNRWCQVIELLLILDCIWPNQCSLYKSDF